MSNVVVYSSANCPYCVRAKELLAKKGIEFQEIRVDLDPKEREIMMERSGRRTVPQIFIDDQHIGGCDDLYALDKSGELTKLLSGSRTDSQSSL
ncbi:MAG: glutaredoxin 3 [Gammaproteobacteria bacterium]|nr:glutaredoxin 3 [Gammaproteobacteria bacterium]